MSEARTLPDQRHQKHPTDLSPRVMTYRLRKERRTQTDPPPGRAGNWCVVHYLGVLNLILTNYTFHPQNLETANEKICEEHHELD